MKESHPNKPLNDMEIRLKKLDSLLKDASAEVIKLADDDAKLEFYKKLKADLYDLASVTDASSTTSEKKYFSTTHWQTLKHSLLEIPRSSLSQELKTLFRTRKKVIESIAEANTGKNLKPSAKKIAKLEEKKLTLTNQLNNVLQWVRFIADFASQPSIEITSGYLKQSKPLETFEIKAKVNNKQASYSLENLLTLTSVSEFLEIYCQSDSNDKKLLLNLLILLDLRYGFNDESGPHYSLTESDQQSIYSCLLATRYTHLFNALSKNPELLAFTELLPACLEATKQADKSDAMAALQSLLLAANSNFTFKLQFSDISSIAIDSTYASKTDTDQKMFYFFRHGRLILNLLTTLANSDPEFFATLSTDFWTKLFENAPSLLLVFADKNDSPFKEIIEKINKEHLLALLSHHLDKPFLFRRLLNHKQPHLKQLIKACTASDIKRLLTQIKQPHSATLEKTKQLLSYKFCELLGPGEHIKYGSQAIALPPIVPIIKSKHTSDTVESYAGNLRAKCINEIFYPNLGNFSRALRAHLIKVTENSSFENETETVAAQNSLAAKLLRKYIEAISRDKNFLPEAKLKQLLACADDEAVTTAVEIISAIPAGYHPNKVLAKVKSSLLGPYRQDFSFSLDDEALKNELTNYLLAYRKQVRTATAASQPISEPEQRALCIAKLPEFRDIKTQRKAFEYLCNQISFKEFKAMLLKTPLEALPLLVRFRKHSHVIKCLENQQDELLRLSQACLQRRPECFAALLQFLPTHSKSKLVTDLQAQLNPNSISIVGILLQLFGEHFDKLNVASLAKLPQQTHLISQWDNIARQRYLKELAPFAVPLRICIQKGHIDPIKLIKQSKAQPSEVSCLIISQLSATPYLRSLNQSWQTQLMHLDEAQFKPLLLAGLKPSHKVADAWLAKLKLNTVDDLKGFTNKLVADIQQRYPLPPLPEEAKQRTLEKIREHARVLNQQQDALQNVQAIIYPALHRQSIKLENKHSPLLAFVRWLPGFPLKDKWVNLLTKRVHKKLDNALLIYKAEYDYDRFVDAKITRNKPWQRLLTLKTDNAHGQLKKVRLLENSKLTLYGSVEQLEKLKGKFRLFTRKKASASTQGQESLAPTETPLSPTPTHQTPVANNT